MNQVRILEAITNSCRDIEMPSQLQRLVDIVIPAHNEQDTIANVVTAAKASRLSREVYVIADDCNDETASRAREAGASVLEVGYHNKGSSMQEGLNHVVTSHVCFLDGDLIGLTESHVTDLLSYKYAHVIGLRDSAIKKWSYGFPTPKIAGERTLPTWVADQAGLYESGYEAEMRINLATSHAQLRTKYVLMRGCDHRMMDDKWGLKASIYPDLQRWYRVMTGTMKYLANKRSG